MLTVATCLWAANSASRDFSRRYGPRWVYRLAGGFRRNLTLPHRFVVFTDIAYAFGAGIERRPLTRLPPDYGSMIEPFVVEGPLIVAGLDTIVTGPVDDLAAWTIAQPPGAPIALPRSPGKDYACNGIALVGAGNRRIFDDWRGQNDMDWVRAQPHRFVDDLFPGQVASFKCDVRPDGLRDARIVYFHGEPKPDGLGDLPWIAEHWRE